MYLRLPLQNINLVSDGNLKGNQFPQRFERPFAFYLYQTIN